MLVILVIIKNKNSDISDISDTMSKTFAVFLIPAAVLAAGEGNGIDQANAKEVLLIDRDGFVMNLSYWNDWRRDFDDSIDQISDQYIYELKGSLSLKGTTFA